MTGETEKYQHGPDTSLPAGKKRPVMLRLSWAAGFLLGSLLLSLLWFWLYASVLGLEPPKTVILKKQNARWASRVERMNRRLDAAENTLEGLQMRDDEIYRNIFGMTGISPEVRNSGFGGVNRYAYLEDISDNSPLKRTALRLDFLTKKTFVQSKSFDDIAVMSQRADDMAACIPVIPPINPDPSKYRLTSPFGHRSDPIYGQIRFHSGVDFAMDQGNPVYATGNGVVESCSYELGGYGNSVVIDHGFGYKTRYAHMKLIYVVEGMTLQRGECIGESGKTGKATGPHLHYEVLYRGGQVNPMNYVDMDMESEEYMAMVRKVAAESKNVLNQPFRRIR